MRIVAFITETASIERILTHIGEPAEPPRISPPADLPPGTMLRSRCRTGTSSASPTLSSISAVPGSHRLLRERVQSPSSPACPPRR
jgi:hypothetical protein